MIRRLPLLPTLVVAIASAVMIGFGFWQLDRAGEKAELIANYASAPQLDPIAFPTMPAGEPLPLFRRATGFCLEPAGKRLAPGRNRSGETGYLHIVDCRTGAEGPGMAVQIGWSKDPSARSGFTGGPVSGIIAPDGEKRMRLVLDEPAAGLQPSARPSVESIPDNHLSYAVQWFLFAAIALVIYGLAVRKRLTGEHEVRP